MESARDALAAVGLEPRRSRSARSPPGSTRAPRCSTGCSRGRGATSARSSRPGRRTTCGSSAGSRPTSASPTPTASTSRPTSTTSRSSRASRSRGCGGGSTSWAPRCCRCARPDVREAAEELLDAERRGDLRLPAVRLPQCRARDPRAAEIVAEVKAERGRRTATVPVYLASELYPLRRDLPRLNSTLIEAYAAEPSRGAMQKVREETKKAGAGVRAAGHGLARGHDLDRGEGARDDARLRSDRRRRRRPGAGGADGARERPLHRHRRHLVRHRADHRRALRDHPDAGHRPLHAQHAAGPDRLDRRRDRLVRARQPELEPARARPRLGRRADRRLLAGGRARDGLDHRPQRRPRARQPRLLPRRRHHSSTPSARGPRSSARSPNRSGSTSRTPPPG